MNTTFCAYQNLPFHRKNGKRDNIYYQVIRRPTNGTSLRRDLKIIRSLVQREGSSFVEVWCKNTKNPVGFDSQHLFFDRFRTCYTSYGFKGKPELLYQENSRKIESALVFESPVDQTSFLDCSESRGYKPCLLAVTKDGWLVRHDLKTGDLLERVYLSVHYRFKHVQWESDLQRVVLKTVHFSGQNRPLMFLSFLMVAPLQFLGLMPVEKAIFGQDTVDATASNGFLVILHQSNRIRFYSLLETFKKYSLDVHLGKNLGSSSSDHSIRELTSQFGNTCCDPFIVGAEPNGVPVNISLSSKPVVLFEVISNQHLISFGGYPWHYIACPQSYQGVFHVRSVKDSNLVTDGVLQMDSMSVEPDQAYFHADNSGRIIHIGPHTIRCFKLYPVESKQSAFELKSCFSLNLHNKNSCCPKTVRYTSSGREIKARSDDQICNIPDETVLDIDYEDELDLLVVLHSNDSGDMPCGVIGLYDNQTGSLVQETVIENWTQDADHSIMMEKDTIVHIMKDPFRKFFCTVYRLTP